MSDRPFVTVFSAFTGADMMINVDGKARGSIQAFRYDERYDTNSEYPVRGVIESIFFDDKPFELRELAGKEATIKVIYANEFGARMSQEFIGVKILRRIGRASVDAIVHSDRYVFKAKRIDIKFGKDVVMHS